MKTFEREIEGLISQLRGPVTLSIDDLQKLLSDIPKDPARDERFRKDIDAVLRLRQDRLANSIVSGHSARMASLRVQTDAAWAKASGNFVDPSLSIDDVYDKIDGTLRIKRKFLGMTSRQAIDEAYN